MDLTGNQQTYCFPLLKNAEILQCISELGMEMTEAELMEPNRHKERVKALFVFLVEIGLGLTEQDLSVTSAAAAEKRQTLPYPDLHEDSFSELKFLKSTMKLMKICGLHDFGWKDLQAPTYKRLRRQLSGVINFAKFREENMPIYVESVEQRDELLDGLQQVNDENSMLQRQLQTATIETENKWREFQEVENDCAEIEIEIAQQNKLQSSIREESTELKKKANELKDHIATAALALQEAEAEERKLSAQVVRSPQKAQREMAETVASLETTRKECASAEQEAKLVQLKISNVLKAQDNVVQATKMMEALDGEKAKFEAVVVETKIAEDGVLNNQRKTLELKDQMTNLEKELHDIEEQIAQNRMTSLDKMSAVQNSYDAAQKQMLLAEKDMQRGKARIENSEAQVRDLEAEIEEANRKTSSEISEMILTFKKLEQLVIEKDCELVATICAG